ncbi:unnamed protein product, partial [Effrenium voratum]
NLGTRGKATNASPELILCMADWQDGVVYNTYINCSEDQIALTCYSLGGKEDKYRMRPDATVRNLSEMLQRQVVSMSREGEMSILRPMDRLRDFVSDEDRVVFCTFGWNQILVLQTLEALAKGAFSKSAFNLDWKSTLGVDSRSLEQRVAEHIGQGAPVRVRRYFLQLMQKYLADAEGWKLLDLSLGQHWRHFVPFTGFKHHWTQHAAELCAFSATTPVPQRPPSMFLFRKDPFGHVKDGLPLSADRQFPRPIQQCALLRKGLEFGSSGSTEHASQGSVPGAHPLHGRNSSSPRGGGERRFLGAFLLRGGGADAAAACPVPPLCEHSGAGGGAFRRGAGEGPGGDAAVAVPGRHAGEAMPGVFGASAMGGLVGEVGG